MTERVPILVGITGKRDLKGQNDAIRRRLRETLDILDREVPEAPKVLLSGMAIGADMVAAELALARDDWLVAAVLPFALEAYLCDFNDAERVALTTLLAHPKVKTCVLPPLRNPETGALATAAELVVRDEAGSRLRALHYEQLGIYLAQAATLLIALLPEDEQPAKQGGTARVVAYRLDGRPDRVAQRVMRRSSAVAAPLPLDTTPLGPVWQIDEPSETPRPHRSHLPFMIRFGIEPGIDDRRPLTHRLRGEPRSLGR